MGTLLAPLSGRADTILFTDISDVGPSLSTVSTTGSRVVTASCDGEVCSAVIAPPAGAVLDTGNLPASGILWISDQGGILVGDSLTFIAVETGEGVRISSDTETQLSCASVGGCSLVETGLVQQVDLTWRDTQTSSIVATDHIQFQSDLDGQVPVPVPESSTWLLFGSGVAGLMLWRQRTILK